MYEKINNDIDKKLDKKIKAAVFDLDGTLADTLESIAYSANKAIEAFGFNGFEVERFKKFAGDGADTLLKRCLEAAGDSNLEYFERVQDKYRESFKTGCLHNVKPYDGITELLNELKKRNIKIAVLSNKPHDRAVDVIEDLFGKGFFDIILGHCKERPKKPSPDTALFIAEKFDVSNEECIYIGDTNTDMKTGKNADMITVGVTWGFREKSELVENGADVIVDKPDEILNLIDRPV